MIQGWLKIWTILSLEEVQSLATHGLHRLCLFFKGSKKLRSARVANGDQSKHPQIFPTTPSEFWQHK
jgi:hypothetical protein